MNFCLVSRVKKKKTLLKRRAFAQPIHLLTYSDILRWSRVHNHKNLKASELKKKEKKKSIGFLS